MLSLNPSAKTLILVPTISLAGQQCTAYEKAGFGAAAGDASHSHIHLPASLHLSRHRVDWFCSDRQVWSYYAWDCWPPRCNTRTGSMSIHSAAAVLSMIQYVPLPSACCCSIMHAATSCIDGLPLCVQLRPEMWASELQRLSVLVMESGSFRNLLASGAARLEHLDLLVSRRGRGRR